MENPIRIVTTEQILSNAESLEKLSDYINSRIEACGEIVYTGGDTSDARKDYSELKRLKITIDNSLKPDAEFCAELRVLSQKLGKSIDLICEFLESEEENARESRLNELKRYFDEKSALLGEFAGDVWESRAFYSKKWGDPNYPLKLCRTEIKRKINEVIRGLRILRYRGGKFAPALIDRYISTMKLDGLEYYKERLESMDVASIPEDSFLGEYNEDNVRGSMSVELNGTSAQFARVFRQLDASGIGYTITENHFPQSAVEIMTPDFDSFVAFDIETSGSLGVTVGDLPSEIIEIGAVRVEHGVITGRFSTLCNPERTVTPIVQELTGIIDEMLIDKPSVSDAVKAFAEFAGNSILLGHGIKNSDFPYIYRVAKRIGIVLNNSYFDTHRYAERVKSQYNFENMKLETLAEYFGINPLRSHRAEDDAETAAYLYFSLAGNSNFN